MQMKHRLSGSRADVENGTVSAFDIARARNLCRHQVAASDDLGIRRLGLLQPRKMPLGNDQHMRRRLRMDVLNSKNVFVLVYFPRRKLAAQDAAEDAIGSEIGHTRQWQAQLAKATISPQPRICQQYGVVFGAANSAALLSSNCSFRSIIGSLPGCLYG